MEKIVFNKAGYDPFIDYLKAYSIFFVVFAHCLPVELYSYTLFYVWGGMQVPMFVLIQTFHAYKKGERPHVNIVRMLKRIVIPFILVQGFIFLVFIIPRPYLWKDEVLTFVTEGGKGPGSYYFWIYLQVAILLPLLWGIISKVPTIFQLMIFLAISIGMEVCFSFIDFPDWKYRLLATRYLFLFFLGYNIWVKDGIVINNKTLFWSVISVATVLFFVFTDIDLEPLFFNTAWETHRWICYFYVSTLLVYIIWLLYKKAEKFVWLDSIIKTIGRCSYEIYLVQMAVFVFLGGGNFMGDTLLRIPLYMILTILLSIVLGIAFKIYLIDKCKFLKT